MDNDTLYSFQQGNTPLLVSMPHVGVQVPQYIRSTMTQDALALPDTDWHVHQLYDFLAEIGVSTLQANYSRYVIDLNRAPSGESLYPGMQVTEICPSTLFDGNPIYMSGSSVESEEVLSRVATYWQPYHQKIEQELKRICAQFGYAILWDAHSIRSEVPMFFSSVLPDLNWGSAGGLSCSQQLSDALLQASQHAKKYSTVLNGRFKGGFITRHYGCPSNNIHAIQLEISQATYMSDELSFQIDSQKATQLKLLLKQLIDITLKTTLR